ncbi:MAG: hypothetical protein N3A58_00325 [Spirochaetes bacterium]|nr:hypothetical protein [Spirochaetota bacterium]
MKRGNLLKFLFLVFISLFFISQNNADLVKADINRKEGILFYNSEFYQQAILALKKSVSFNPKDFLARYFLGWSYYKSGFIQNALVEWQNLKELGFEDQQLENMVNNIMFQEGKLTKDIKIDQFTFFSKINGKKLKDSFFIWPLGLDVDPRNNVYFASHRAYSVMELVNGEVKRSINIFGKFLGYPYDVVFNENDNTMYVSDYKNNVIYKLTKNGTILKKIGLDNNKKSILNGPAGIAIDNEGQIYCIDQGNNRVVKFDKDGNFLFYFGEYGEEYGKFFKPIDIVFDSTRKVLYISNNYNKRVDVFDLWGNYIYSIGENVLKSPKGLTLFFDKYLYILDNKEIYIYNFELKTIDKVEIGNYEFFDPYYILIDKNQNLIVTDPYRAEIVYFVPRNALYLNLDVKLERIDIRSWPLVVAYVSVKDQFGNTIYGLTDNNFSFWEYDSKITRLSTEFSYLRDDFKSLSIVIDSFPTMKNKIDKIVSILTQIFNSDENMIKYNFFLSNLTNQIVNFSNDKLKIFDQVKKEENYSDYKNSDRNLYSSITSFFQKYLKGGIIYITDGNYKNDSFLYYSQNDIINYAKINYIPVYVFYIGDGNGKTFLKELASKTGGAFYEGDDLFNAQKVLLKFINYQSPCYIVYYKSPFIYKEDFFRKVMVEVNYNGRVGKNWLGYYMKIINP